MYCELIDLGHGVFYVSVSQVEVQFEALLDLLNRRRQLKSHTILTDITISLINELNPGWRGPLLFAPSQHAPLGDVDLVKLSIHREANGVNIIFILRIMLGIRPQWVNFDRVFVKGD